MKRIVIISVFLLSGCASIMSHIPSFWDDNQSHKVIDIRLGIEQMDCASPGVLARVDSIRDNVLWFQLYSQSKGARQTDVLTLIEPLAETVNDMSRRGHDQGFSRSYCELKQRILRSQSQRASEAILGRF